MQKFLENIQVLCFTSLGVSNVAYIYLHNLKTKLNNAQKYSSQTLENAEAQKF